MLFLSKLLNWTLRCNLIKPIHHLQYQICFNYSSGAFRETDMDSIEIFQVFIIIIMILYCLYFRSLTSSSSSSTSSVAAVDTHMALQEKYDVFISFRGDETRDSFTSHLHKALLRKNIETYMDDRLEKGYDIRPALKEAIQRSKIALVIFSEDYASSTWCLNELVHILRCKKNRGQNVIPIFYRIDPSDVRRQKGTYALEGPQLKKRFKGSGDEDEVANWRAALEEAGHMSGFHYSSKTGRTEADFVEQVVQSVLTKLSMSTKPKNDTEAKRGDAFNISGNRIEGSNSGRVGIFKFGNKNVYKGHKREKQVDSTSGETDSASGGENEE